MEYFGFISGILYLFLEIRQNKLMWMIGMLCAIAYIVVFAQSRLYAAMGLQVYYLGVSMYGFFSWTRDRHKIKEAGGAAIVYRIVPLRDLWISVLAVAVLFSLLLGVLRNMTGDPMPVTDALATVLSIVATWWLSKSYIHQWLVWIVVNILSVSLFLSQELYLTAVLYFIYAVCAVYGFYHWRKKGILLK